MHKFDKDLRDQQNKNNDLKLNFLISSYFPNWCCNQKHTERCVEVIANNLHCNPTTPVPEHTAGIDNTQMDIDDIEEVGAVATTSAIGYVKNVY